MYILIEARHATPVTPLRVTDEQYAALSIHQQALYQVEVVEEAQAPQDLSDGGIVGNDEPQSEIPTPPPFEGFGGGISGGAGATGDWDWGNANEGSGASESESTTQDSSDFSSNDGN